jgi:hypothetical protein
MFNVNNHPIFIALTRTKAAPTFSSKTVRAETRCRDADHRSASDDLMPRGLLPVAACCPWSSGPAMAGFVTIREPDRSVTLLAALQRIVPIFA